jgi:hypothetical protein
MALKDGYEAKDGADPGTQTDDQLQRRVWRAELASL